MRRTMVLLRHSSGLFRTTIRTTPTGPRISVGRLRQRRLPAETPSPGPLRAWLFLGGVSAVVCLGGMSACSQVGGRAGTAGREIQTVPPALGDGIPRTLKSMKSGEVIIPQQGIGVRYATSHQFARVNLLGATWTDTRPSGRMRSQRGMSGYS